MRPVVSIALLIKPGLCEHLHTANFQKHYSSVSIMVNLYDSFIISLEIQCLAIIRVVEVVIITISLYS